MCPVKVRKVAKSDGYRVTHGGQVSAKSTTKAKAEGQARLLRGIAHGMKPRAKKKTSSKGRGSRSRSKR